MGESLRLLQGLSSDEAGVRMDDVGVNEIPFRTDTLYELVSNEFITFFYGYQWVFYQLWFWFSYLFVAIIMSSVVLLSAVVNIWLTHRSQVAIAKISEYITDVEVLRDGEWVRLDSRMLLPGDVVRLPSDWLLPADFVIIQGQAVCNESALTGEAMPVQKYQCPNENQRYSSTSHAGSRHTLYAGTTLLQAGSRPQDEVLAVVSATGMSTSKGDLLSAILYPQRMIFKYDEELVVVVILMITYAAVCAILSVVFQVIKGQQSVWVTKWVYMVFIISQILSPILPVALNVGQMNAMERLKKKGINCLNAKRIAISGKIRVFCFDKTGTLTRDGLDFLGAKAADGGAFGDLLTPADSSSAAGIPPSVMNGLATCHAVSRFGDAYVGNQVEVRMFEATGWQLMETSGQDPRVVDTSGKTELTIVKRFEFDHTRATMSVVVRDAAGQHFVYCKGSFEKIREVSQPESLPESYLQTAQGLALEGCYVLGMSTKSLGSIRSEEATSLSRNAVEEGLSFSSLLVFRNELKPDTRDAIIDLKSGAVRPVMITGDNAQCGQYVAKASGMTHPECPIYLAEMTGDGSVKWSLTGQENAGSAAVSTEELIGGHIKELQAGSLELAVTGKAFQALRSTADMQYLLFFCRIFARVTPEEKVQVCNLFRDAGLVIGMAGDGGNDCGALRAAHAGVALSDAEASVVSPFTSKSKSVRSVVDLLREGRGALHTSFAAVKFLVIYGLNFSVLKLGSYWYGIIVCSFMYLSIDAFAVLTLGYALTLSHPAKKLNKMRPTSSLIGPLHVASVFGYFVISLGYLVGALYLMQSDKNYVPWPTRLSQGASWWTLGDNWESTILFFTLYFNFLSAAFIFTFGSTFRRTVFRNWVLIGFYVFLMTFYSWLLLSKPNSATRYYHIASQQFNAPGVTAADSPVWTVYQEQGGQPSPAMSMAFRWKFWGLCMGNVITLIIWQKGVAEGLVSGWMRKRFPSKRPVFNY